MSTWTNQSKNSATWDNQTRSTSSLSFLLLELGDKLLLENGDKLALEQGGPILWVNQTIS